MQIFDLSTLTLKPEDHVNRRNGLGGSDATILAKGNQTDINNLARLKWGEIEPTDLTDSLPVMMGQFTEPFNLAWLQKKTGREVHSFQKKFTSSAFPFMRCTLDGISTSEDGRPAIVQAKHTNPFKKLEDVVLYYTPQITHEMICTGFDRAILSILIGNLQHEIVEVILDPFFASELIDTEKAFWDCVIEKRLPYDMPSLHPPVPQELLRKVDMTKGNEGPLWLELAGKIRKNKPIVEAHKEAVDELKSLVPYDAKEAFGGGVRVSRTKTGLTIRLDKE